MKYATLLLSFFILTLSTSAQGFLIKEDFNDGIPNSWINVSITGFDKWKVGLDGSDWEVGDNNIDGTQMVFFDDEFLGSAKTNNTIEIKSPSFDNSNKIKSFLEFDYNFRTVTELTPTAFDSLYVEIYDGTIWHQIFSVTEDDCGQYTGFGAVCLSNGFPRAKIDITSYANKNCQVSFRYHDGNDWAFYAALDNIWVTFLDSNDVGVSEIISPNSNCGLSDEFASVEIINYGLNDVNNFDVVLDINGGTQIIRETILNTIKAGDTLIYTFKDTADLSLVQNYSIMSYTDVQSDNINSNDTAFKEVRNDIVIQLPYHESFEGNIDHWRVSGTNSSWERGIPQGQRIDFASDSVNVYATHLIEPNNDNELSYLTSPCIAKIDSIDELNISFDLFRYIEFGDRLSLEYSVDNGLNWNSIPKADFSKNWYTSSLSPFWNGSSNGWQQVENSLSGLAGFSEIKFRFKFQSNAFNPNFPSTDGAAIDNFKISFPTDSIDLALLRVTSPRSTSSDLGLQFENPSIQIANFGLNQVDSFEVSYTVDSSITVTEKVIQSIGYKDFITYTFKDSIDFNISKLYKIDFKVNILDDQDTSNNVIIGHTIDQISNAAFSVPYRETFDQFPPTINPEDFQNLPDNWLSIPVGNTQYDQMSWKTGNTSDLVSNTEERGKIFYSTHNQQATNASASIVSPFVFIQDSETILSYWYYRVRTNALGGGDLYVDIFDGKVWHNALDSVKGALPFGVPPAPFEERQLNLGQDFLNKKIRVRFRTTTANFGFQQSIVAIDDVSIYIPSDRDIKLTNLSNLDDICLFDSDVRIRIENIGNVNIQKDSIKVFFQVNNAKIATDTIKFALTPQSDSIIIFNDRAEFEPGINILKIWSEANGVNSNFDTVTTIINTGRIDSLIFEDFENYEVDMCPHFLITQQALAIRLENGWQSNRASVTNYDHCIDTTRYIPPWGGPQHDNYKIPPYRSNSTSNQHIIIAAGGSITSPCFSLANNGKPILSFDYSPNTIHHLRIDVLKGNNNSWTKVHEILASPQNSHNEVWEKIKIPITSDVTKFRFIISGSLTFYHDHHAVSIDNIQIYDQIPEDVFLQDVLSPKSECNLSNNEEVKINVINNGSDTIKSGAITAKLYLNNVLESTETISTDIFSDSSLEFSFNKTLDLSAVNSSNSVNVELELNNDSNLVGNVFTLPNIESHTKIPGYIEDFESFDRGYYNDEANSPAYVSDISNTGFNMSNQIGFDIRKRGWIANPSNVYDSNLDFQAFHWNVQKPLAQELNFIYGGTVTIATGPETDHSPNGETFIYTEASGGDSGDTALFIHPCVDLTDMTRGSLQFWYHKYGADMGDLFIDIYSNGNWNYGVDTIAGETHFSHKDPWKKRVVSLNPYAGNNDVQIQFRAIRGNGEKGDMAIDNVHLFDSLTVGVDESIVEEVSSTKEIKLYPNPNNGLFKIRVSNDLIGLNYFIIDLQGKIISSERISSNINNLDLSNHPKGLYMLRIPDIGETKKVIIY